MRSRVLGICAVGAVWASALVGTASATEPPPTCFGLPATIAGDAGHDVLFGTDDADVIVADEGHSVVFGRGGDDFICTGSSSDVVFGGRGDDRVSAGGGNDFVFGGRGNDTIEGGAGEDHLFGDGGADTLDGGAESDALFGGRQEDLCLNGEREHSCELHASVAFDDLSEGSRLTGAVNIAVAVVHGSTPVDEVRLSHPGGAVGSASVATGTSPSGATLFVVPWDTETVPDGPVLLTAEADLGGTSVSAEIPVDVANVVAEDLGAHTVIVFDGLQPLSSVVAGLEAAGVAPLEFFHSTTTSVAEPIQGDVQTALLESGVTDVGMSTEHTGGFALGSTPLTQSAQIYTASWQERFETPEPTLFGLRAAGDLELADLGGLALLVSEIDFVDPDAGLPPLVATPDGIVEGAAPASSGLGTSAAPSAVAQQAATTDPFWPTTGHFSTDESSRTVNSCGILGPPPPLCFFIDYEIPRGEFTHTPIWSSEALAGLRAGEPRVYEHDFKLFGEGVGFIRPACLFDASNFWAYRNAVFWDAAVAGDVGAYLDTDISDECSEMDLTVGFLRPENIGEDTPDPNGWQVVPIEVETDRGDPDSSPYALKSQSLLPNGPCKALPDWAQPNCVGLNAGDTIGRNIVGSSQNKMVPDCINWWWEPIEGTTPEVVQCGENLQGPAAFNKIVLPETATVTVTAEKGTAQFTHDLSLIEPTVVTICNYCPPSPVTVLLGTFSGGTELVFQLYVQDTDETRLSTDPGVVEVERLDYTTWRIGFEDYYDNDFDDLIVTMLLE